MIQGDSARQGLPVSYYLTSVGQPWFWTHNTHMYAALCIASNLHMAHQQCRKHFASELDDGML